MTLEAAALFLQGLLRLPETSQETRPPSRAVFRELDPAEAASLFRLADRDRSGWVSYRESRFALDLDRDAFSRFDADGDGAVTPEEFERRCRAIVEAGGALPGPESRRARAPRGPPSPLPAWLASLDPDGDGRIPIAQVLERLGPEFATQAKQVLEPFDRDRDGSLDQAELFSLHLAPRPAPASAQPRRPSPGFPGLPFPLRRSLPPFQ